MSRTKEISKKLLISVLIFMILYSFLGIFNLVQAATSHNQSVKSGISAFPESYQAYLKKILEQHPNWTFDAYYTGISWDTLVANETDHGHNRIISSSDGLLKCSCGNVASGYACASSSIIKYYMDPRNFINSDSKIFQFLESSYNNNYNIEVVKSIIKNTFMNRNVTFNKDGKSVTMSYADIIMEAAKQSSMSPYSIAIKIIQEVGVGIKQSDGTYAPGNAVSGTYDFVYTDGKTYKGYYNFFNYGAADTGNAVTNGLRYAKDKGWDTPYKSIIEGAKQYTSNYLLTGQNTIYFTKWDVVGTSILKSGNSQTVSSSNMFWHQYMTNIVDPTSQSKTLYNTYVNNNLINENLNFVIPVYDNMPLANKMPTNLTSADGDLYYTTGTDILVRSGPSTSNSVLTSIKDLDTIVAVLERETAIDSTGRKWDKVKTSSGVIGYAASQYLSPCGEYIKLAQISGNNVKAVPNINISKMSSSLGITNYEVTKDGKVLPNTDIIGTGYKLKDKSNGKEYVLVVLGEVNGDAEINSGDLLALKKYLLGTFNISI